MKIQQLRFDKLKVSCTLDSEIEHFPILKLLLQPLVENAIYHGLEHKTEEGKLEIRAKKAEGHVFISIRDNGVGIPPEKLEIIRVKLNQSELTRMKEGQKGMGIENVSKRIKIVLWRTVRIGNRQ